MKIYRSPVYPALLTVLPSGKRIKAVGGYFNVQDEDVEAFEAFVSARPHYRIAPQGSDGFVVPLTRAEEELSTAASRDGSVHGTITPGEPISDSERHPETVTVDVIDNLTNDELRRRLAEKGLPTDGNKAVLVKRLADATDTSTGLGDSTEDSEGDDNDGLVDPDET